MTKPTDIKTIPLHGHLVHVWRQSESDGQPFAWSVVRDDLHQVGTGAAETVAQAWERAIAMVDCSSDATRRACAEWGKPLDLAPVGSDAARALPGVGHSLERIYRCAYGLETILDLLTRNDLEESNFREGDAHARPLSGDAAEGLGYAGGVLARLIREDVERIGELENHHV